MPNSLKRSGLLLLVLLTCGRLVASHPTMQEVWARHDQIVMRGASRPVNLDPAQSHLFKGRGGRSVRGWDVGPEGLPAVLWWNGGPGAAADPAWDINCFEDASRYRHLEIDSPGTGQSSWVEGWKPEDTVDDAATFLRLRGIRKPILVVGYSWGSTMALLFAQRHPELVSGVVVGGVWTNTRKEVETYLGGRGNRAWIPGMMEAFNLVGPMSATSLHAAIRAGRGGMAMVKAYDMAESLQSFEGLIPRKPLIETVPRTTTKSVQMATEQDDAVRFAYIESEMMARGEQAGGPWAFTSPSSWHPCQSSSSRGATIRFACERLHNGCSRLGRLRISC